MVQLLVLISNIILHFNHKTLLIIGIYYFSRSSVSVEYWIISSPHC